MCLVDRILMMNGCWRLLCFALCGLHLQRACVELVTPIDKYGLHIIPRHSGHHCGDLERTVWDV